MINFRKLILYFNLLLFSDDPYWEILSPPIQYVSVGTNVTLSTQYASLSQGHGNDGPEFLFALVVEYFTFNEMLNPIIIQPSEALSYQWDYRLTVNSSSQGLYNFSGNKPSDTEST